jgi:hypothetical protein
VTHSLPGVRAFPEAIRTEPLLILEHKIARLSSVVRQLSPRRDACRTRAQILLSVLRLRCPFHGTPASSWYVPGAVARLGARGLHRSWPALWLEPAPAVKTFKRHLRSLVDSCCLLVSPGDWLPSRSALQVDFWPRYPDTIHIVDTDEQAEWLAGPARFLELQFPKARTNPTVWWERFSRWRSCPPVQTLLFAPSTESLRPAADDRRIQPSGSSVVAASALERLVRNFRRLDQHQVEVSLLEAGVHLTGPNRRLLFGDPLRLMGAVAILAQALRRASPPRARAGFLVYAFRRARPGERDGALRVLTG